MDHPRNSVQLASKFNLTYSKLLQGQIPSQINPNESDPSRFYSSLLVLDVNRDFLEGKLNHLTKETCFGPLKSTLNALFLQCLTLARDAKPEDARKTNAFDTLSILTRCILKKNLSGLEIMEVFAGGTNQSDSFFKLFTSLVDSTLVDPAVPPSIRHQALQLALSFMCGVGQLSPGAYFLRKDLFPSLVSFIKSPETEQYTFEAALLLAILANFHKSDAAKLNPYLHRIHESQDRELMRKICWASNFALDTTVKAYQTIHDDNAVPTFASSLGSVFASLRPDRALASTPVDPPRELFKDQPIEACVILLPVYEFMKSNPVFSEVLEEYLSSTKDGPGAGAEKKASKPPPPLPITILSLSSYLLTHATSTSSPRSLAYADLSLSCLLAFSETESLIEAFIRPWDENIRLCRQRLPLLPVPHPGRPPVCALLDCCALWLRHNLHLRLEVSSYGHCIWICYRVIWFLSKTRTRLEYEWKELWSAILGLLTFFTTKLDSLFSTGGVENLVRETILLLDLCLTESSSFLPNPHALYEFMYELVRSVSTLEKQATLLKTLSVPHSPRRSSSSFSRNTDNATGSLTNILNAIRFYEEKIKEARARTANQAMRVVAREIDRDGIHGQREGRYEFESVLPKRPDDVLGFSRYACQDGLALM
ncbi:hypothetical protein K435DRAFT_741871 [Dendrothele bispora CBS 962.96]|uniref:Armadillo-like helical domain-containing protein n=1 Tax=Dendrothele bispora (strain CBS 962.96) TaxID=1314807 RepID=A0A4S8MWI9_DENBC|nr:hypothetical protein K435DRAFT_741871 [Dendrothele bispora CBS 962.96]